MLRVSEMTIQVLHSCSTPVGMEPVLCNQVKIWRCIPLEIRTDSQFGIRYARAEYSARSEYPEGLGGK
jgi:hypothetical protein